MRSRSRDRVARPAEGSGSIALSSIALAVAALLLAAACTSADERSPTETVTTTPRTTETPRVEGSRTPLAVATARPTPVSRKIELVDGLPTGAVGPLLVFTEQVRETTSRDRGWPTLAVVTYDIGAGREVASFEVGGVGDHPSSIVLAGREIVVNVEHSLNVHALNGDLLRTLREAPPEGVHRYGRLGDMAVSRDGATLAISELTSAEDCRAGSIVFLDVATGDELLAVTYTDPRFQGLRGMLEPAVWRDDGLGVLIRVITSLEAGARIATVMLDGTVVLHEATGFTYPAPSGRRVAHGPESLGCMFTSGHIVTLTDLDSGAVLNRVEDETRTFLPREWSPDGSELLYSARPFPSDPEEVDACEWPSAEPEWFLLPAAGDEPVPVAGPLEVRRRWEGDRAVTFICEGVEGAGWHTRFTLTLRAPDDCVTGSEPAAEIIVGGRWIVSSRALRVLGFIEVREGPP